jgi:hypothetical protein
MIAQRMMHSDAVEILDEAGKAVRHTPEFIARLFDEEVDGLSSQPSIKNDPAATARLREARRMSEEMIHRGEFDPA